MLARLQVVENFNVQVLALPQVLIGTAVIQILQFPNNGPWQLVFVNALRRAGASTLIDGVTFYDPAGTSITEVGFVPWLSAGTTETSAATHTPRITEVSFFGTNISSFIANDFNLFNGFQWTYQSLIVSAGGTTDITLGFVQNG